MSTFAFIAVIIIMAVVQVLLSMRKSKWLGFIIPIINLSLAMLYALNRTNEGLYTFFIMFIGSLAIYVISRTRLKRKDDDEIRKMKIDDLE
jgi:hypothetical protein